MKLFKSLRRKTAWLMIAMLINPLTSTQVYARDSDIYLFTATGTTTAEPDILIILDTSDSMNLPEAWREYAPLTSTAVTDEVNYDSHVEYLWNDCTLVNCTTTETTAASSTAITTAAATVLTPPGSWAGATVTDRRALWTAAKTYAQATLAGDPGPRSVFRNYNNALWIYWLPAGTATTDARLRSPTFNRWAGANNILNGLRGLITYSGSSDYRGYNRCRDSGGDPAVSLGYTYASATVYGSGVSSQADPARTDVPQGLTPSTVYAPSAAPRNSGRYLNTAWLRWERFLDLRNGRFTDGDSTYPTTIGATTVPASGTYPIASASGYANVASNIRGRNETISLPDDTSMNFYLKRDSWPNPPNFGSITTIGDRGQPIRTRKDISTVNIVDSGDSRSGWTTIKADLGGFNFADNLTAAPYPYNKTSGANDASYQVLNEALSWYGLTSSTAATALSVAWKGNRDAGTPPSFDMTVGTPAYVDQSATRGSTSVGSTTVTLNAASRGASGLAAATIVNIPGAGPAGANLVTNVTAVAANGATLTIANAASTAVSDVPITRNLQLTTSVSGGATRCTTTWTLDADGVTAGVQSAFVATTPQKDANNTNRWYQKSGALCVNPSSSGSDCTGAPISTATKGTSISALGGDIYYTQVYTGCSWSGRASLTVEGVGTYYYGGTCGAAASCIGPNYTTGASPCAAASYANHPYSTSNYQTRNFCSVSGVTDLTVGSTAMAGAVLNSATTGCGNLGAAALTCAGREGLTGCTYANTNANASFCPTDILTTTSVPTTTDYTAFANISLYDSTLYHDCMADEGTTMGNPTSGYLNARTDHLYNSAYNLTVNTTANNAASYTTAGGTKFSGIAAADMYSVNYLNWKFGPKGPNGYPIGRKTRLQIAKDSLTTLVSSTNSVRFGLMVFNRTAGCASTNGTLDRSVSTTTLTIPGNPGFVATQAITIAGAGAAGAALNTTITAINSNPTDATAYDLTIATPASTSVVDALVSANPCSGSVSNEGANIAYAIKRMGSNSADADYVNRAALINAINAVTAAARTPLTESMYEAYRYFSGRSPRWGTSSVSAIAGGAVTQGRDTSAICTTAGAGSGCTAVGNYKSPMLYNPNTTTPAGCQDNYVVMITDGGPEDDSSANPDIKRLSYAGVTGTVSARTSVDPNQIDTPSDQFQAAVPGTPYGPTDLAGTSVDGGYIWLDELAYFMAHADVSPGALNLPGDSGTDRLAGRQFVKTYTIGFAGGDSPVLQSASNAQHGEGNYYVAENSAALSDALQASLNAIVDWSPTDAAPSVPISAYSRGQSSTDIYFALFQPDTTQAWLGTVKKFALSTDPDKCGQTTGGDQIGLCTIGQTTLNKSAPNYSPTWNIETQETDESTGTTQVIVDPNTSSLWAPLTDGGHADQGGSGYQLLNNGDYSPTTNFNPSTRHVYTMIPSVATTANLTDSSNALSEANTYTSTNTSGTISKAMLGLANTAATDATATTLINYVRGGNPGNAACSDNNTGTACTAWRTWPHAGVEHSKPAIVRYNLTTTPPTQYLYYLSGDGLLHAINANTGREIWVFLVDEALPQLAALMADNDGAEIAAGDGSISVYQSDDNGNGVVDGADKVWLYFGLRRGGRAVYALDVTAPTAPLFKWKITGAGTGRLCTATGCSAYSDYNELGQTWSTPQVGKIRALGASTPALIFGGGYDTNQDNAPVIAADTQGRALYVVNGDTGATVKWFGNGGSIPVSGMNYAIPADPAVLNTDFDAQGYIDRIYVGDLGGNMWRFNVNDSNSANWTGKKLASLSDASGPKRKIFFPPSVVQQTAPLRYDAVFIGSGDKEHPLNTSSTTTPLDKIFMIEDRNIGLTSDSNPLINLSDLVTLSDSQTGGVTAADITAHRGWQRELDVAEKVTNAPTVFDQKLTFGSYSPGTQTNACTPPGEGRLNEIDAQYGGLSDLNPGDGSVTASDRYYANFTGRGYMSTAQFLVLPTNVTAAADPDASPGATPSRLMIYRLVCNGLICQKILVGGIGSATKVYWYMEPEQ